MKFMNRRGLRLFAVAALLPMMASTTIAQTPGQGTALTQEVAATQQVTRLLLDFLSNVPRNDRQVYDNFFADDVIYTRSAGVTIGKAEIMKGVGSASAANEPASTYSADDITVHAYIDLVVVNFRLVQHKSEAGRQATVYYRNTGTFLKRNGKWQVVAWQATRVPEDAGAKPQA